MFFGYNIPIYKDQLKKGNVLKPKLHNSKLIFFAGNPLTTLNKPLRNASAKDKEKLLG